MDSAKVLPDLEQGGHPPHTPHNIYGHVAVHGGNALGQSRLLFYLESSPRGPL